MYTRHGPLSLQLLLIVNAEVAILAFAFGVVGFVGVLALGCIFGVTTLMVAGAAHVLGAVLFVYMSAEEFLTKLIWQLMFKCFLTHQRLRLLLNKVGVHGRQVLYLDRAHIVIGENIVGCQILIETSLHKHFVLWGGVFNVMILTYRIQSVFEAVKLCSQLLDLLDNVLKTAFENTVILFAIESLYDVRHVLLVVWRTEKLVHSLVMCCFLHLKIILPKQTWLICLQHICHVLLLSLLICQNSIALRLIYHQLNLTCFY